MKVHALTQERFAGKALIRNERLYGFAAKDSLVPVVAAELPQILPMMPLGFVPGEGGFVLVAVASLEPGASLFVAPESGQWLGGYVPASLRTYPFRMLKDAENGRNLLYIADDDNLIGDASQGGEPFFDENNNPSQFVASLIEFLSEIEGNRMATQMAVAALEAAGLIQPWSLQTEKDSAAVQVKGLFRIDEAALNALDADTLKGLREKGALAIAYAQLFSMNQLSVLEKLKPLREQLQAQVKAANLNDLNLDFLNSSGTISFGNLN